MTGITGIKEAARLLQSGSCVAVPTETVYGLAANALNESAVRDIFTIKGRPLIDPLIVHLLDLSAAKALTELDQEQQKALELVANQCWPGALTLVLPKAPQVPDLVTANRDSVAIRCPAHPLMRQVLEESGLFLAAPSANPFGYVSPTTADHVARNLGDRCPYILDGGQCEAGVESTILDLRDPKEPIILRPGPVGREELQRVLDRPVLDMKSGPQSDVSVAPGQLERHYSPRKHLSLHPVGELPKPNGTTAQIFLARPKDHLMPGQTYWLSEQGNLSEVAHNLFALLHKIDAQGEVEAIQCEIPEAGGIADAIRDRLSRASKR